MSNLSIPHRAPYADRMSDRQIVAAPTPQEGLRRALRGSFGSFPAMPAEFARLLDRLN